MFTIFSLDLTYLTHFCLSFLHQTLFHLDFFSFTPFHLGCLVLFFIVSTLLVLYY